MFAATSKMTIREPNRVPPRVRNPLAAGSDRRLVWDVVQSGRVMVSLRTEGDERARPLRGARMTHRIQEDEFVVYPPLWSSPGLETD